MLYLVLKNLRKIKYVIRVGLVLNIQHGFIESSLDKTIVLLICMNKGPSNPLPALKKHLEKFYFCLHSFYSWSFSLQYLLNVEINLMLVSSWSRGPHLWWTVLLKPKIITLMSTNEEFTFVMDLWCALVKLMPLNSDFCAEEGTDSTKKTTSYPQYTVIKKITPEVHYLVNSKRKVLALGQ